MLFDKEQGIRGDLCTVVFIDCRAFEIFVKPNGKYSRTLMAVVSLFGL